jgi:hypothetical protein
MNREGPPLEALMHRLAEAPADFLAEPRIGKAGIVDVGAVANDLLTLLGAAAPASDLLPRAAGEGPAARNRLSVTLLLCWLYAHEWFARTRPAGAVILHALREAAGELSQHTQARMFLSDLVRREEFVRTALAHLDYRPEGETLPQAQDRLAGLSAAERARVVKASREAEERSRSIREALVRKAAEESADKWTRE